MSNKVFRFQLFKDETLCFPKMMKAVENDSETYLFVCNKSSMAIYSISDLVQPNTSKNNIEDYKVLQEKLHLELPSGNLIVDIFSLNERLYLISSLGNFFELHFDGGTSQDNREMTEDGDLFDSPLQEGWCLVPYSKLPVSGTVIAAQTSASTTFVMTNDVNACELHVYNVASQCHIATTLVERNNVEKGIISSVLFERLAPSLRNLFFKHKTGRGLVVIVGCSSGAIYSYSRSSDVRPELIYRALQAPVAIHLRKDSMTGLYSELLVLLSGGPVLIFSGNVHPGLVFMPVQPCVALFYDSAIVVSDSVDTWSCDISRSSDEGYSMQCTAIPVKGVISMCFMDRSKVSIVCGTRQGGLYRLTFIAEPAPLTCSTLPLLPDQCLLDAIQTQLTCMDELASALDKENSIMKAVSLTTRSSALRDHFAISAKVLSGTPQKLKLHIKCARMAQLPGQLWKCLVAVACPVRGSVLCARDVAALPSDIIIPWPATASLESTVSVYLVARVAVAMPWLILPIGMVNLDASYFIEILEDPVPACFENIESVPTILNRLAMTRGCCNNVVDHADTTSEWSLKVQLPVGKNEDAVMAKLLRNSKHKFKKSFWNNISGRPCHLLMTRERVTFRVNPVESCLKITAHNITLCYLLKQAAVKQLGLLKEVKVSSSTLEKLQGLHQSLEVARMGGADWKVFYEMWHKIRNELSMFL